MHRVLSLLPGATEIVCALGAQAELVGVSHECDFPESVAQLPRVTASAVDPHASSGTIDAEVRALASEGRPAFTLDADMVRALAPTVVITQTLCDVCAVDAGAVYRLGDLLPGAPAVIAMKGRTLPGVWDDIRAIARAIGREREAEALLASLDARSARVHETLKAARALRPRVAVIEWLDPLFAAGHWTPALVKRAGGIDVLAEPGAHSVRVTLDQVRAAEPEVILFAPCGFGLERAVRESRELLAHDEWAWARELRTWAIDGNALTSRAGPRLVDAIETMAAIFAPGCFGAPGVEYAAQSQAAPSSASACVLPRRVPPAGVRAPRQ